MDLRLTHSVRPFHVSAIHPMVGKSRYPASTALPSRFITSHSNQEPTE